MRHHAKFHQNRSNGCRHGDLTVFNVAAVRHLAFVTFEIFNGRNGQETHLHQRTKFRKDRSNRYGDIAIFVIFKMVIRGRQIFVCIGPPEC